jgi:hypothetical protein
VNAPEPKLARLEKDRWGYYQVICMRTNVVLMSAVARDRATAERWAIAEGYSVTSTGAS